MVELLSLNKEIKNLDDEISNAVYTSSDKNGEPEV